MASLFMTPAEEVQDQQYRALTGADATDIFSSKANMDALAMDPFAPTQPMGIAPPPGSGMSPMVPPSGMPGVPSFGEMPPSAPTDPFAPQAGAPSGAPPGPPQAMGGPMQPKPPGPPMAGGQMPLPKPPGVSVDPFSPVPSPQPAAGPSPGAPPSNPTRPFAPR